MTSVGIVLGSTRGMPALDVVKIIQVLNSHDIPAQVIPDLRTEKSNQELEGFIAKNRITHLIIGTPDRSEVLSFLPQRFPQIFLTILPLFEQPQTARIADSESFNQKAIHLLLAEHAAIISNKKLTPPEFLPESSVTIIGGGVAGIEEAILLSEFFTVNLIERTGQLGGNTALKKIAYPNQEEIAKLLKAKLELLCIKDNINIFLNANILDVSGNPGDFVIKFSNSEGPHEIKAGAIIISTGFREGQINPPFDDQPNCMTNEQLGGYLLSGEINSLVEGNPPKRILFVDLVYNEPYEIQWFYLLHQVIHLLKMGIDCHILTKNVHAPYKHEYLYREARSLGAQIIIGSLLDLDHESRGPLLATIDIDIPNSIIRLEPDCIVISTPLGPIPETEDLLKILALKRYESSFVFSPYSKLNPTWTGREGIFVGGGAWRPMTIPETLSHASASAFQVYQYLSRKLSPSINLMARVDESLCIGCEYCQRVCAFRAIEMIPTNNSSSDGTEKQVASIIKSLCKGCGNCSSTCPTGAIQLQNFDREYFFRKIETLLGLIKESTTEGPIIIGLTCQECAARSLELLEKSGIELPATFYNLLIPCAGRIGVIDLLKPLAEGADGVIVFKCPETSCHYFTGSHLGRLAVEFTQNILEEIGFQRYQVQACDVIAANSNRYESCINKMVFSIDQSRES